MENRYEEMLAKLKDNLFDQLKALQYGIELDCPYYERAAIGQAFDTLNHAIESIE